MNKQLELQTEFQKLAGQKSFELNQIPDIETRKLRLKLALEELKELANAFGLERTFLNLVNNLDNYETDTLEYNQIEVLDALIDIAVINNGSIITCGFETIFDREYENVDKNNKTKFHKDYLEALKTQTYYRNQKIETEIDMIFIEHLQFYIVKNSSGKVLKPYNYQKVELNLDNGK